MIEEFKYVCKCGAELPSNHTGPCPKCGKSGEIHKAVTKISLVKMGIKTHAQSRARNKGKGFSKFKKETLQGWFPSGDPKLKNGVNKVRIADKEKDDYQEVVENAETGEIIRDIHEPLNQHRHINK